MANDETAGTRRDVLRTAAALGATGVVTSLAGCQQIRNAVGLGKNHTKQVPEDAENAVYVDVQAARDDEAVKKLTNVYLDQLSKSENYDGPSDYEEAREQVEDEADLDPGKANWQIGFSNYSQSGSAGDFYGTIMKGGWNEDDVVDSFEDNYDVSYDDDDHEGKTIYEPDDESAPYIGVLSNNKFVTGNQDGVEATIEVKAAGGDKMDKELRKAYGNTKNAPVRFVSEMLDELPEETNVGDEQLDLSPLGDVNHVAGSVYKNGDKRGIQASMYTDGSDDAKDVADLVDGYFSLVAGLDNAPEDLKTIAGDVEVEQNGNKAVVSYEETVDELADMLEDSMSGSMGGGGSRVESVRAGASMEFDETDHTIAVTWTSNQNAETLQVTFQNQTGGSATGRTLTSVGESTTYDCPDGDTVRVVVTATADDDQAVIATEEYDC